MPNDARPEKYSHQAGDSGAEDPDNASRRSCAKRMVRDKVARDLKEKVDEAVRSDPEVGTKADPAAEVSSDTEGAVRERVVKKLSEGKSD